MNVRILSFKKHAIACFSALCALFFSLAACVNNSPPGDVRTVLTVADLMADYYVGWAPVNNAHFMPVGPHASARHVLEGTLSVPEFEFRVAVAATTYAPPYVLPGAAVFPGVDLEFFVQGGSLVPVRRGIIKPKSGSNLAQIIVSPGKTWSEPGDEGFSRASFPFTLVNAFSNNSHNGIATFLFDETRVSSLRVQIVQEAANWAMLDMWGQSSMTYRAHAVADRIRFANDFADERAREVPMRSWSELKALNGGQSISPIMHKHGSREGVSAAGLIVDGVIYAHPCHARYGDYPYCRQMRHGVYSVTKTMGAAISLLRLAQKFGPGVFDLRIANYVDINVDHDGWDKVTFAHVLGMAVGVGYKSPVRDPLRFQPSEDNSTFLNWMELLSAEEKLSGAFDVGGNYPWRPGEVARYDSMHTFILSAAMDSYLKTREGPDADLWDMVRDEVLRPIGAFHVPIMRTVESDGGRGLPIMGFGLYLTIDDVAKIAALLQSGGKHAGRQLLHPGKLAEALYQTESRGLPTGGLGEDHQYQLSFWMKPFNDNRGCETWLPKMVGYGGNIVMILPNGVTAFRFADNHQYGVHDLTVAAHEVRPLCRK